MKTSAHRLFFGLLLVILGAMLLSCEEEELTLNLNVTAPSVVKVNQEVLFEISGTAETFVIYTGDTGHEYENSFLALGEGEDPDQEVYVLTQDSLTSLMILVDTVVEGYNIVINRQNEQLMNDTTILEDDKEYQDTLNITTIESQMIELIDVEFTSLIAAEYFIATNILPGLTGVDFLVERYFTNKSVLIVPDGGYATGFALDRYDLNYTYSYQQAGSYIVTVVATDLSNKKYSGSGYKDNRSVSSSEYTIQRIIRQVTVTVED